MAHSLRAVRQRLARSDAVGAAGAEAAFRIGRCRSCTTAAAEIGKSSRIFKSAARDRWGRDAITLARGGRARADARGCDTRGTALRARADRTCSDSRTTSRRRGARRADRASRSARSAGARCAAGARGASTLAGAGRVPSSAGPPRPRGTRRIRPGRVGIGHRSPPACRGATPHQSLYPVQAFRREVEVDRAAAHREGTAKWVRATHSSACRCCPTMQPETHCFGEPRRVAVASGDIPRGECAMCGISLASVLLRPASKRLPPRRARRKDAIASLPTR